MAFQVSSLATSGRHLFIGTTAGTVGKFDSETLQLVTSYHWHKGKCRTLLAMPREMEPCICAEIPFPEKTREPCTATELQSAVQTAIISSPRRAAREDAPRRHPPAPAGGPQYNFSHAPNPMFLPNRDPDSVLITSVGSGGRRMVENSRARQTMSKAQKLSVWEEALTQSQEGTLETKGSRRAAEDICLLTWRS